MDVRQQFFKWMGKYFAELCLVFGCSSSVGLFDRLAKVFLYIAAKLSSIPIDQVEQIIDDTMAVGSKPQDDDFYLKYREVANSCGVKLASECDPKKAFSASQQGEIFGVNYCTVKMDMVAIIHMLQQLEERKEHSMIFLKRITGKLIAYRRLILQGKYYMGQLVKASSRGSNYNIERIVMVSD